MKSIDRAAWIRRLSVAGIAAIVWGGFGWLFFDNFNFMEQDVWAMNYWVLPDYSQIFSFRAMLNPHFNMADRRIQLVALKLVYDFAGNTYYFYNLINLAVHLLNCLLVYAIARRLYLSHTAGLVAGLFLLGNVASVFTVAEQIEAETGCLFFLLLSVHCHLRYCRDGRVIDLAVSLAACYLSIRTKPYGYLIPVILLLYHATDSFLWRPRGLPAVSWNDALRTMARALWGYGAVCLFVLLVTCYGIGYAVANFRFSLPPGNPYYSPDYSLPNLIGHLRAYLGLYAGDCSAAPGIGGFVLLGAVALGALAGRQRWALFGLAAAGVLFVPMISLIAERAYYAYVPSAFFALAIAGLVPAALRLRPGPATLAACRLAMIALLLVQLYALPWFRRSVDQLLYSVASDRAFIAFMTDRIRSLPPHTKVVIDGIDAAPNSALSFPIGLSGYAISLCFLFRDCSLTWGTAETHAETAALYDQAPAPKLLVRLVSPIHKDDWPALCRIGDRHCVARVEAGRAVWTEAARDFSIPPAPPGK